LYFKLLNSYSITRLLTAIITFRLLLYILYENNIKVLNVILNNSVLIFVGKISYGIYLIHTIGPWLLDVIFKKLELIGIDVIGFYDFFPIEIQTSLDLIIQLCLVVLLAWISWTFYEKPILSYKKLFMYKSVRNEALKA